MPEEKNQEISTLSNPAAAAQRSTHESQAQLREVMGRAGRKVAEVCQYFEQLTGVRVRGLRVMRWDGGEYTAQIELGSACCASEPPAPLRRERG
jgi:hypothetical protein